MIVGTLLFEERNPQPEDAPCRGDRDPQTRPEETITDENYPFFFFTQIVALLKMNERDCCFQKDGTTAHSEK